MTETRTWTRCILLMPPGFDDPEHLKGLIAAREWISVDQRDPWLAMAEVCIRQRAVQSRSSWGLPASEILTLVIAEPVGWPLEEEFLLALHHYAPTIELFRYVDRQLVAVIPEPSASLPGRDGMFDPDDAAPIAVPTLSNRSMPSLHLARSTTDEPNREATPPREPPLDADARPESSEMRITPEEIDMLLATNPGSEDEP